MRIISLIWLTLALPGVALAATPEPQGNPPKLEVSFADIDLSSAEGEAAFENRVRKAANRLCNQVKLLGPRENSARARCVRDAMTKATPQIAQAVANARSRAALAVR